MEDELRRYEPWLIGGIFLIAAIFGQVIFIGIMALLIVTQFVKLEISLPLLFVSGLIKTNPIFHQSPIDITAVALVFVFAQTVWSLVRRPRIPKNVALLNLLIILMACSTIYTVLTSIAPAGYVASSGINVLVLYLPLTLIIINNVKQGSFRSRFFHFRFAVLLISSAWVGVGLYNQLNGIVPMQFENPRYEVEHMSAFGENYMYFSSFSLFLLVNCFVQIVFLRRQVLINLVFTVAFAYLMLNSPARGLTAGLVITGIIMAFPLLKTLRVRQLIAFTSMSLILIIAVFAYQRFSLTDVQQGNLERLTDFNAKGKSISDRLTAIENGYGVWSRETHFVLMGMGSGSIASLSNDPGLYAHNIVIELLFEYGFVGSLPYFLYFMLSVICAYRVFRYAWHNNRPDLLWAVGVFTTMFLFGLVSNTLGNMRLLWILTSLMINAYVIIRRSGSDLSETTTNFVPSR